MSSPFFDLAFDIPADQAFTYRADKDGTATVGKRAMVPFGNRGRESLGYIIGERDAPPEGLAESAIKPIRRVVDAEPLFDERDIELARWIAAYYLCGIGQAISAMIPSGRRMTSFSSFADDSADIAPTPLELSPEQQTALDAIIGNGEWGVGSGRKEKKHDDRNFQGSGSLAGSNESGRNDLCTNKDFPKRGNVRTNQSNQTGSRINSGQYRGGQWTEEPERISTVPFNSERFAQGTGNTSVDSGATQLSTEGFVETTTDANTISRAPTNRSEKETPGLAPPLPPLPTPHSPFPLFYLYGITGSGKTEVFLRAAEAMLKEGKSVIYLVPEISLTHQTAELIGRRFGQSAAMLHSGMSPSARLAEWGRIRQGQAPIVIGPRSAIFAPVPNLGLIIIDEEHDGSYKSGNTPRYHARQTAIRRCSVEGAKLVMGSATPSAEAWKLMAEGGIQRLDLSRRLSGGSLPEIKPVSLEKAEGCLTKELKDEIRLTAQMKRQTILFLNRRGFAHFYHCPSCGYEQTCKRCSVSLTWHKSKGKALCHYCGYGEAPPSVCPRCGSLEAGYRGFGTEMIEEEVLRTFPDLHIRRADADAVGKKGQLEETLSLFRSGMVDVLLGTQMVAKGLNFPGVRLVGVILADTGLHLPDFRAAERTFSLLVQVAGRAGRYFPDGKVIVQTLRMGDPVITRSCAVDVEGFFNAELAQRQALNFPPYTRLIRLNARSRDPARADTAIRRLAAIVAPLMPPDGDMLGPAECPIGIINGNHRRQLILRGKSMGALHGTARVALQQYEQGRDARVYVEVDVDPVSLL